MPPSVPPFIPLDLARIRQALRGATVGHTVRAFPQVPSTMPLARELVAAAPDPAERAGWVVVTEEQTAGRGRHGRRWEAPPGRAILASVVISGELLPPLPAQLPMLAGLAVLRAVAEVGAAAAPALGLKWPNDVVWRGPDGLYKLAGILIESALGAAGVDYAILGLGINVNQTRDELPLPREGGLPPTSLALILGHPVDRTVLFISLCRQLGQLLDPAARPSAKAIHEAWRRALVHLGRPVRIRPLVGSTGPVVEGRAVDTTVEGGLVVETPSGARVTVETGDALVDWGDSAALV